MEIVKGEGIVLDLSETRRISVVNGGGSIYWDAEFQGMLRTNQYGGDWARFFPKAEILEGVPKVRFSYIECNNAKEAISRSRGINEGGEGKAGIRRGELEAFFKAIEDIHKLENTATEPDKKSFISNLRLPDPTISPEKYRIYIGNDGKEHLAVLWGYERLAEHDCCDTHPIDEFKRKFVKYVLPDTIDKLKFIHKVILGVTALLIAILLIVLIIRAFQPKNTGGIGTKGDTPPLITNGETMNNNGAGNNNDKVIDGGSGIGVDHETMKNNGLEYDNAGQQKPSQSSATSGGSASNQKDSTANSSRTEDNNAQTNANNNRIVATDGNDTVDKSNSSTEKQNSTENKSNASSSSKEQDKSSSVNKSNANASSTAKEQDKSSSVNKSNASNTAKEDGKTASTTDKTNANTTKDAESNTAVVPVKIAKNDNEVALGSKNDVRVKISDMTLQKKKVMVTLELEAIANVKDSKITNITMDGRKPEKLSGGKAVFLLDLNHRYKVSGNIEYAKNGQKYTNSIDDFLLLNLGATLDSAKE